MRIHSHVISVLGLLLATTTAQAVETADITDGAVTTPKIAAGAVTGAKLATGAVNATKLANSAVTANKLASGAVTTGKVKDAAITAAKLAAGATDRAVDILWLGSDTTWNLPSGFRDLDGVLGTDYRKIPFAAADRIDFGIPSSMTFDDATDSVTINKEGLYAFRFRSATLAASSGTGEYLPVNVEINVIRGVDRMRLVDAQGIAEAYETNGAGEVFFPAKPGDVVYAVAGYAQGPGLNGSMVMANTGYLRNREMSIVLIHPGPAGNL